MHVWLVLSAITLVTWFLGSEHGGHAAITYAALLMASIKVRLIVVEFMEARRVSKTVQLVMDSWLFLLVAGLLAIYAFKLEVAPT